MPSSISNSSGDVLRGGRKSKRCSSPEKWELKQLVAAGVLELEDLPWYNDRTGILKTTGIDDDDDSDEEIEIGRFTSA